MIAGTTIEHCSTPNEERLKFRAILPQGGELLDCYHGILICGLESWTDEMLDRRLYEASNRVLQPFLNKPPGVEPLSLEETATDPEEESAPVVSKPVRRVTACPECQEFYAEIAACLAILRQTVRMAEVVNRDLSRGGLAEFVRLLRWHIQLRENIQRCQAQLMFHMQTH